ncbi:DUF1801 domain-containing protein [Piscinibacterium candidicorallinum]|jgi:hypothetical protein|uniref:DUF1801 domain-containing protein n=1 Tax=Piscinibacterium candidicorallinum TaxID=1793872 RepID=A0ABV7H7L6_9BURK
MATRTTKTSGSAAAKRTKADTTTSTAKTQATTASVDDFIAAVADDTRRADCVTVRALMEKATGEKAVMWGSAIVGFGAYRYEYASGRTGDWPIIAFSPRKNDLTLYIMPGTEAFPALMDKLGKYKTGKSCLYLKTLADVDAKVLKALIDAAVKAMAPKRVRPSN